MTLLAHLSDLHLLENGHERRTGAARARLAYLSFGRPVDAERRRRRVSRALEAARAADHVILTGDLTEDGLDAQFEVLAELLAGSRIDPSRVTVLPGNHDAYTDGAAFERALSGPLRPWAETSFPGVAIRLRGAVLVGISSSIHQPVTRSTGAIAERELDVARAHARATRGRDEALVLAVHHPPRRHVLPPMQWIDGLRDHAELTELLLDHDHAHVLHGHTHVRSDDSVRSGGPTRVFSPESVVSGDNPVRFYSVRHGRVFAEPTRAVAGVGALAASW